MNNAKENDKESIKETVRENSSSSSSAKSAKARLIRPIAMKWAQRFGAGENQTQMKTMPGLGERL